MTSNLFNMGGPLAQNPLDLDPQTRRIQQLLMQQQPGAQQPPPPMGVQDDLAPQAQPAPISGAQQAQISKARNAPVSGMGAIMGASTPTAGTALAKTLAAGLAGQMGGRRNEKQVEKLERAFKADAKKEAEALGVENKRKDADAAIAERRLAAYEKQVTQQGKPRIGKPVASKGDDGIWRWFQSDDRGQTSEVSEMEGMSPESANRVTRSTGPKPPAAEVKAFRQGNRLLKQFDRAAAVLAGFDEGQREMVDQPGWDIALNTADVFLPEGLSRFAEENMVYPDKDVRSYRTQIAKLESDFSRMMSGLAVTGFEMKDRKKWSPYAEGISQQERESRLTNLRASVEDDVNIFKDMYSSQAKEFDVADLSVAAGEEEIIEEAEVDDEPPPGISSEIWGRASAAQKSQLRQKFGAN